MDHNSLKPTPTARRKFLGAARHQFLGVARGIAWAGGLGMLLSLTPCLTSGAAFAASGITISPYASVSSTKAIKPEKAVKKDTSSTSQTETVTQKTTYGLKVDVRLSKLFYLGVGGGTNKTDVTRKSVAMRDEYGDIDFQKDANVDPNNQDATYKMSEQQNLARAEIMIQPIFFNFLWAKAGVGVRARQRLVTVTDSIKNESTKIKDPIRYAAVGTVGLGARLLRAFSAHAEYKFYFLKFPKTQPHEQEALIGFGVTI